MCRHVLGGTVGWGSRAGGGAAGVGAGRRVVGLEGEGSALCLMQGLWKQAREGLDVTTVIVSNRRYAILQGEMTAVGANLGPAAQELFNLDRPATDWQSIAKGFGIPATQATDMESFVDQLNRANAGDGPRLIELMI